MPERDQNRSWVVNRERWPLVIIRPPSSGPKEETELIAFYEAVELLYARRRPYVVLYDIRGVVISAARRERLLEWAVKHDAAIRAHMIALAVLVSSELERGHVTTGFWNLRQSYHARIFESLEEAERWLLQEFARGEGAN